MSHQQLQQPFFTAQGNKLILWVIGKAEALEAFRERSEAWRLDYQPASVSVLLTQIP